MSIFNFYEEIKKGLEGNYFLYSEEPFMLQEAYYTFSAFIKQRGGSKQSETFWGARGEDPSLLVLDISENPPLSQIIEALKTPAFFSSRGWIVIKEAQLLKLKDFATIAPLLERRWQTSTVTFATEWEPRVLFLSNKIPEREVLNTLKEVRFISVELKEDEVLSWIELKAKNLGIELSRGVIQYLIELTEGDPGLIATELNKIAIAGIRNPSQDELKELVFAHLNYDTTDLVNAIKKKDRVKAVYILKSFKDNLPLVIGVLNKIYSSSPDYKKALPVLHEMDFRAKAYKDFLEPLLLKLLELEAR